jgi:lipid II:glycine glycyltransferase (peptidoglycan interpeptide bridge formation enzyme)
MGRLLGHVQDKVDAKQSRYFEIRPLTLELPSFQTALAPGNSYRFHSLDLRRGTDEIFRAFHKDCIQRKIRRAEREGLRYDEGNSDDLLHKFYRLMVMTRRRQGLPPQPLKWFQALISAFRHNLSIRVASKDNVGVASILTLTHKKSMVYKYGCSDAAANKFGGMPLLFWKAIQDAKDKNCEELDMGRSDLENRGLIEFKGHLGADARVLQYWTYPSRVGSKNSGWKLQAVGKIVSASPDWMVKVAGSLLYRHIG